MAIGMRWLAKEKSWFDNVKSWFANVKRWFANDEGWFANVKRWFANYGLMFIYLFVTIVLFIVGWVLQHIAFTPPPPASPVYAAVFVDDPAAHVDLTANVDTDQPWNDSLTVAVKDASGKQAGWLLVIECPPGAPTSPPPVPLYSEAALQTSSSATPVTVYSRVRTHSWGASRRARRVRRATTHRASIMSPCQPSRPTRRSRISSQTPNCTRSNKVQAPLYLDWTTCSRARPVRRQNPVDHSCAAHIHVAHARAAHIYGGPGNRELRSDLSVTRG